MKAHLERLYAVETSRKVLYSRCEEILERDDLSASARAQIAGILNATGRANPMIHGADIVDRQLRADNVRLDALTPNRRVAVA